MKSWKTTLSGVVALGAFAFNYFAPGHEDFITGLITIAVAWGFLTARDHNK